MFPAPTRKRKNEDDSSDDGAPMAKKARESESENSYSCDDDDECGYHTYIVASVCKNVARNEKHPMSHRSFARENVFLTTYPQTVCHHYINDDGVMATVIFMRLVAYTVLHANYPAIQRVHKSVSRATTPNELIRAIDATLDQGGDLDTKAGEIIAFIRATLTMVFCTKMGVRTAGIVDGWCGELSQMLDTYDKCDHVEIMLNVK
jgi:hypothetical protein